MPTTILSKSYVMLTYQFDCRFVLALSFDGSSGYLLTLSDREGQIRFQGTSLTHENRDNVSTFLRIICYLMFGLLSDIGLDPQFVSDPLTGTLTAVKVDDRHFEIHQRLYTLENMLGRGTKVWVVSSNNARYILKDSWVQKNHGSSEVTHLKAMLGHKSIQGLVPTIICGGDVRIDGRNDWTGSYRGNVLGRPRGRRIHRRIVTTPIGEPITTFRSKKEFISALMDIVQGTLMHI
jgi:Fungal protein kinase